MLPGAVRCRQIDKQLGRRRHGTGEHGIKRTLDA